MHLMILKDKNEIAQLVSGMIINLINKRPNAVLGLATGASPLPTYELLVKDYQTNHTDWSQVVTFNLDEYVGLDSKDPASYHYFMHENLFKHLNIKAANIHIPNGLGALATNVQTYETLLTKLGPIDFQLLGIGENGHIAFNEPGSEIDTRTRVINLTQATITTNQRFFTQHQQVPKQAITMGIASILQAKTIVLIATGTNKAMAIKQLVHGVMTKDWPCTYLQNHNNVVIIIDEAAGQLLEKPNQERKN